MFTVRTLVEDLLVCGVLSYLFWSGEILQVSRVHSQDSG